MHRKLVTIIGARPQFVKAAALSRAFEEHGGFEEVIVHTGQHYDKNMSEVFFREMDIPTPNHQLHVRATTHGAMTGKMLEDIESVLLQEKPDAALVYGDTNSTLAGALAASKLHIPLIHVEAGLRSFDMRMPEEVNRIVTDRVSQILFCPTRKAIANLEEEHLISHGTAFDLLAETFSESRPLSYPMQPLAALTGDIMQDAAFYYASRSALRSGILSELNVPDTFGLCTIHRAENTDEKSCLARLCEGLERMLGKLTIILPLHPRTKKSLEMHGLSLPENVIPIAPVGYFDMLELLKGCSLVLTDSGGLQKEAYFFEKPCITLREHTEWVELVESGANVLTGTDPDALETAAEQLTSAPPSYDQNLYGGGRAGQRMARFLSALS